MKLDVSQVIMGVDNVTPMKTRDPEVGAPPVEPGDEPLPQRDLTLRDVIMSAAVNVGIKGDEGMSSEDKVRLFKIATTLSNPKESEFEIEVGNVSYIKNRIGVMMPPIVVGRVFELLG